MSTKIYNAYKVKEPKTVWPLLWAIKERVRKEGYEKATTSHYLSKYNLDVRIYIYPHKGQFYLIGNHDHSSVLRGILDFLDKHRGLEDFHFQNQTDKPKQVTEKAWRAREKIWNEIMDSSGMLSNTVVLDICNFDIFWQLDPWLELYRKFHKNPPKLPSREEVWAETLQKYTKTKIVAKPGLLRLGRKTILQKARTRWYTYFDGKKKAHSNLNRAADYALCKLLPENQRRLIDSLFKQAQAQKRKDRAKARKSAREKI